MENRRIGTSMTVSPIGMGCMGFSHGYGQIPERSYSIEAIRAAHDFGCTFYDTAEGYGLPLYYKGHNEEILGEAVKDFRRDVVLATKFHFGEETVYESDAQVESLMRSHLVDSLKHLGTDYVDLYYLHRVNLNIPVEVVAKAMGRFIEEGLIRGWGMSQVGVDLIRRAHEVTPVSAIQNIYSMVERGIEAEVEPYCMEHQITIVPFSPIASGLLSGKVKKGDDFSHVDDVRKFVPQLKDENIEANQPLLDLIAAYAAEKKATMAQISLAWMLHKYPNVVPIPGSKNKERILENLGAWNVSLSSEEFEALEQQLNAIEIHGYRGFEQYEGSKMSDWGKTSK